MGCSSEIVLDIIKKRIQVELLLISLNLFYSNLKNELSRKILLYSILKTNWKAFQWFYALIDRSKILIYFFKEFFMSAVLLKKLLISVPWAAREHETSVWSILKPVSHLPLHYIFAIIHLSLFVVLFSGCYFFIMFNPDY